MFASYLQKDPAFTYFHLSGQENQIIVIHGFHTKRNEDGADQKHVLIIKNKE